LFLFLGILDLHEYLTILVNAYWGLLLVLLFFLLESTIWVEFLSLDNRVIDYGANGYKEKYEGTKDVFPVGIKQGGWCGLISLQFLFLDEESQMGS
jgi:hypothetical protein